MKGQCLKINIQKAVKCLTVLFAVVAITLSSLAPTVSARGWMPVIYDPWEYEISSEVDGDVRTVTFAVPVENPITAVWLYNDGNHVGGHSLQGASSGFEWDSNSDSFLLKSYYLGGGTSWLNSPVSGSVISVKDLKQGSSFVLTGTYKIKLDIDSAPGTLTAASALFVYDSNGDWLTLFVGQQWPYDVPVGVHDYAYTLTFRNELPENAAYIVPYLQVSFEYDDSVITSTGGSLDLYYPDAWTFKVPINMVLENTQTMHAIEDKLGDISDKLDDTNDKLDDIISGGEAGDELQDATGPVNDAVGDLDDALGDYQDTVDKLPTAPDSLPSPDNDVALNDAISDAQDVFDWEASGLMYMYAPMGLSLSLAILFYVIFGKR